MKKYLDLLFIKSISLEENLLSNSLFISYDKTSALRKDYNKVVVQIKKYDNYEIVKEDIRVLHEGYSQGLFVIRLLDKDVFLRLILSNNEIYDALLYTIKDIDFINKVFFSRVEIKIPEKFIKMLDNEKAVLILMHDNNDYRILKANPCFYNLIKYEDWDYDNKYQNSLNTKAVGKIDLNKLNLYRSDNTPITIDSTYENDGNIYCVVQK